MGVLTSTLVDFVRWSGSGLGSVVWTLILAMLNIHVLISESESVRFVCKQKLFFKLHCVFVFFIALTN
jgi:hypothetical protein